MSARFRPARRALRRAVVFLLPPALAGVALACSQLNEPAPRAPRDGGTEEVDATSDTGADARRTQCQSNTPLLIVGDSGSAILPGDKAGQAVLSIGKQTREQREAGPLSVSYLVLLAGDLALFPTAGIRDLASATNLDLATCAYCVVAYTNCHASAGNKVACDGEYRAVAGRARAARVPNAARSDYWVDLDSVELARVTRREGFAVDLDRDDCMTVERMALIGEAAPLDGGATCDPPVDLLCPIADTASQRSPLR